MSGRKFATIVTLLPTILKLLQENRHGTLRELYYMHPYFRGQKETDEAILDIGGLLNVPRHFLHISGAVKGSFSGNLIFKTSESENWRDARNVDMNGIGISYLLTTLPEEYLYE